MEFSDSTLAVVPISLPEEPLKNNTEDLDEVTDALQGAQGATTINRGAVKAEATKVAKAKSAGKKDAYQTSLGSSIAKNRPKRACTLKRMTVAAKAKATKVAKAKSADKKGTSLISQSSIAKNRPRRACTLKSTSLGQPTVEAFQKVLLDSSVSQKRMSDFFPQK